MNFRRFFAVQEHGNLADIALLVLRMTAGLAFVMHGMTKMQNPFGWMGPDGFAPPLLQALAALSEFGGGLAWILGFLTRLASLGIASTMLVAFATHVFMRGDPFVSKTGGPSFELASVYLCIAALLIVLGPGRLSLDRQLFGSR